jgi:hypothetical protein
LVDSYGTARIIAGYGGRGNIYVGTNGTTTCTKQGYPNQRRDNNITPHCFLPTTPGIT